MRARIRANREAYDEILCLYGDCGTGGELDRVLAEEGVSRIEGAHCYAFYAGEEVFAALAEQEPGTFTSPIFSSAISMRSSFAASASTASLSCATITSAIIVGWFIWRSSTIPIWRRRPRRRQRGSASPMSAASPACVGSARFSRARRKRKKRRGRPDRALLARHPSQVIVKAGRSSAKRQLSERFIRAIDAAAMHAGARSADAYLAEWQRGEPIPCGDDLEERSCCRRRAAGTGIRYASPGDSGEA